MLDPTTPVKGREVQSATQTSTQDFSMPGSDDPPGATQVMTSQNPVAAETQIQTLLLAAGRIWISVIMATVTVKATEIIMAPVAAWSLDTNINSGGYPDPRHLHSPVAMGTTDFSPDPDCC